MTRLLQHIRKFFRLQPGKPALWPGLRAAVAVTVPFCGALILGLKEAGWAALTGLMVTLADRGGSYRGRARVMGITTIVAALAGGLAAPAGGQLVWDVCVLFVGVVVACFARCYGETAGSIGEKVTVVFVASLGAHAVGLDAAVARGGALLAGGLWAMVLSLVVWPLHPYLPARKATAGVYRELAALATNVGRLSREDAHATKGADVTTNHSSVRLKIEEAREALAMTRVARPDEPRRTQSLLRLLELSEPSLTILLALEHALEVAKPEERLQSVREQVTRVSHDYTASSSWVAEVARDPDKHHSHVPLPAAERPAANRRALPSDLPASVVELLARLADYEDASTEAADAMQHGHEVSADNRHPVLPAGDGRRHWLEPLREHLSFRSLILQHAVRAGLVASIALAVTRALGLGQAFWVVLSAVGILQPHSISTEERALQRGIGTLLGGTLAVVVAAAVGSKLVLLVAIGLLTAVSVSLLPLNFAAFQMFLTPDFLLLATLNHGDWTVARNRALGVLIACVLALVGAWLFWPNSEKKRFPDAAAGVLRADGNCFRQVAARRRGSEPEFGEARRTLDLAMLDAEASFDRLVAEFKGSALSLEPAMALLTYARRLAGSAATLGEQRPVINPSEALEDLADKAGQRLEILADALRSGALPPSMPPLPIHRDIDDPVSGALAARVPRQLEILQSAVEKLTSGLGSAAPAG